MKSFKIQIVLALLMLIVFTGCEKKFEEYSQNENLPLQVPPSLVLSNILNDLIVYPGGDVDKWDQFIVSNYDYYGINEYWSGSASLDYGSLRNVLAMENRSPSPCRL